MRLEGLDSSSLVASSRRENHLPRPLTPPYRRFRIRRFLSLVCSEPPCPWSWSTPALPCGFRPLLPAEVLLRGFCSDPTELWFQIADRFGPSSKLPTTMASADFCPLFGRPHGAPSTWQADRPPRVMRIHLHANAHHIYAVAFRTGFGL